MRDQIADLATAAGWEVSEGSFGMILQRYGEDGKIKIYYVIPEIISCWDVTPGQRPRLTPTKGLSSIKQLLEG